MKRRSLRDNEGSATRRKIGTLVLSVMIARTGVAWAATSCMNCDDGTTGIWRGFNYCGGPTACLTVADGVCKLGNSVSADTKTSVSFPLEAREHISVEMTFRSPAELRGLSDGAYHEIFFAGAEGFLFGGLWRRLGLAG